MTEYEKYQVSDTALQSFYDVNWLSQTVLTTSAHTVAEAHLVLKRVGDLTGKTLTVSIRATSSGKPTGSDLTSGTYDASAIPTSATEITIPITEYTLTDATLYAIVIRNDGPDVSNCLIILGHEPSGYADGATYTSVNSGSTWGAVQDWDHYFEIWGNATMTDTSKFFQLF